MMQEAMIGKDAVPGLEVMSDDYSGFRLWNTQARAMPHADSGRPSRCRFKLPGREEPYLDVATIRQ